MDRVARLLKHADLNSQGIEVAPYFNPAVPKRDGHNVLILDVFDSETLRAKAVEDPQIPNERIPEIEDVDLVGDASRIGEVVELQGRQGEFSYIVSSHNFEHLPNPILFLQGCYDVLAPGGTLSMAVPDCRACFDHFRMPTRLSDWLEAFHEDRVQPSPETLFDFTAMQAMYHHEGNISPGCSFPIDDPAGFKPVQNLDSAYKQYLVRKSAPGDYMDAHCSVFFPASLKLLLSDLHKLGLMKLEILEISETDGLEFYVHLRKPESEVEIPDDEFFAQRHKLLVEVSQQLGSGSYRKSVWAKMGSGLKALLKRQ